MAKAQQQGKKKGGARKHGRTKRKAMRYGSPISRFVRGKIEGSVYFRLTRQKVTK
jgi:hypothetical protein